MLVVPNKPYSMQMTKSFALPRTDSLDIEFIAQFKTRWSHGECGHVWEEGPDPIL